MRTFPDYNGDKLIDAAIKALGLRSDAALARCLGMEPCHISRVRSGSMPVGATILVRLSEEMDLPVKALRALCQKEMV